jgi:hypothetical protein
MPILSSNGRRRSATLGLRFAGIELKERSYDYDAALAKAASDYRRALVVMTSTDFFFDHKGTVRLLSANVRDVNDLLRLYHAL